MMNYPSSKVAGVVSSTPEPDSLQRLGNVKPCRLQPR